MLPIVDFICTFVGFCLEGCPSPHSPVIMDALLDPLQCALLTNSPLIILMHLSVSLPPFSVCISLALQLLLKLVLKHFHKFQLSYLVSKPHDKISTRPTYILHLVFVNNLLSLLVPFTQLPLSKYTLVDVGYQAGSVLSSEDTQGISSCKFLCFSTTHYQYDFCGFYHLLDDPRIHVPHVLHQTKTYTKIPSFSLQQ